VEMGLTDRSATGIGSVVEQIRAAATLRRRIAAASYGARTL
jgi:hypothetical protein